MHNLELQPTFLDSPINYILFIYLQPRCLVIHYGNDAGDYERHGGALIGGSVLIYAGAVINVQGSRPVTPVIKDDSSSMHSLPIHKRAICRTHEVKPGEDCPKLASVCGVSPADFTKLNSFRNNMCSTLREGDIVCCSAGDPPPKPQPPKKNADGTCASLLIGDGDTCSRLGSKYGVTEQDLEKWNAGKTWAWTNCPGMMKGYKMCISDGLPPMPAPKEDAECGPMVRDTKRPSDSRTSLANLNPCLLNACCSNRGFCGPFDKHCAVHSPPGGGPGSVAAGFRDTCISNCGRDNYQAELGTSQEVRPHRLR